MKKNREELENALYISIDENIFERRKIKDQFIKNLQDNYNISPGKAMRLYNKSLPISALSNAELYVFTKALYEVTNDYKIKPEEWFNSEEIKTYSLYKETQYYKGDVITLYNVDQVNDNQWCCSKATYQEINNIFSQGLGTYNYRTQRNTVSIAFNNIATEIPNIRQTPIIEMTNLMLKGKFTPNMITFNIRKTGTESYDYNAKERTLSIMIDNDNTWFDIIDGMHRCLAMMRAVEINPNINGYTFINILNYSEEDAQFFILQEDHRTPINKSHLASFKNDDNGVIIAKYLNKYGNEKNNELFNQIATNDSELKSSQWKYVTVETFAKAFNYNFKVESPREFTKIQEYLKDFFNELIGILKERKIPQHVALINNLFIGYIAIAASLYDKEDWKSNLETIVNQLDLNSDEITSLGIARKTVNLATIKRISSYFKKIGGVIHV